MSSKKVIRLEEGCKWRQPKEMAGRKGWGLLCGTRPHGIEWLKRYANADMKYLVAVFLVSLDQLIIVSSTSEFWNDLNSLCTLHLKWIMETEVRRNEPSSETVVSRVLWEEPWEDGECQSVTKDDGEAVISILGHQLCIGEAGSGWNQFLILHHQILCSK